MTSLARAINRVHLLYLGLLPSLATFMLLRSYGHPLPFLLFVGGVAMVGVYLAATYHYTHFPRSPVGGLWLLLDGPLFALAAQWGAGLSPAFVIEGFLIDGLALWLAIIGLAVVSSLPSPGERVASIGIGLVVLGVIASLFWPYLRHEVGLDWVRIGLLILGVVESTVFRYTLLQSGRTVRMEEEGSILYIALLVMLWVGAMSAGMVVHDMGKSS